jgi:hypothetical protein
LHINKTIAKTAGIRMFNPLYKIMEENNISAIDLNKNHNAHNYWQNFDNNTFIFTVIRNPFERTIAEYIYFSNYDENGIRKHSLGRDEECPTYSKESLFDWINNKHIVNYQSKIISGNNIDKLNINFSRINLSIKAEQIKNNENYIRNKILLNFNIDYSFSHYPQDFEHAYNPIHNKVYEIIAENQEIKELINSLNKIDWQIYNQCSNIFSDSSLNTDS